jgi:MATE family multidrug resistance protein
MTATRSFVAPLLRIAGPVALARLGIIGMALVDTIVVGQLAPDELPHQALGWAPTAPGRASAGCPLDRRGQ